MHRGKKLSCLIDASSLRILVRYFLPLDEDGALRSLIKSCFDDGRLVLLKSIAWEVRKVPDLCGDNGLLEEVEQEGDVILRGLQDRVKSKWTYPRRRKKLSSDMLDEAYKDYLKEGDYQLLAYCLD